MTPAVGQQRDVYTTPLQKPAKPRVHANPRPAEAEEFADDAVLRGVLFSGTVLTGCRIEVLELENSRLAHARLSGGTVLQSMFSDTEIDGCDFANFCAQDASLVRCRVSGSKLTGSHWRSGHFIDVTFSGGPADLTQFRHSKFKRVVFQGLNFRQADFQGAELSNVSFEDCDLTGAQFANCKMSRVEFSECTLLDIGGTAGLKGATVRGSGSAMELALSLARDAGIAVEM